MTFLMKTFVLLLISISISLVTSSCLVGQLTSEVTSFGTKNQFCDYNGLKILPGSSFRLAAPDCLQCRCTETGLNCCGFGFAAGTATGPAGCVSHNDACKLIFVKKDKPTELCQPAKVTPPQKKKKPSG